MASIFQDKSILVALDNPPTAKMLIGILKILQFKRVDSVEDGAQAFRALIMNPVDGRYLVTKIRDENSGSPNVNVPVLLNAGQSVALDVESLREDGFTDLLLSPFSFDDVKTRLSYVLKNYEEHSTPPAPTPAITQEPPNPASTSPEQDQEMVQQLLGHYIAHHEAVLQKLKMAQNATAISIEDMRSGNTADKPQSSDVMQNAENFQSMWGDVIEMFVKGGVGEEDIFKIEKLVSSVPSDIKKHYDALQEQKADSPEPDHESYRKAKDVAKEVQSKPNLMTGMTSTEYEAKSDKQEPFTAGGFIFHPKKSK